MTFLHHGNVYALPALHYTMECAIEAKRVFDVLKPDCVAVELAESLEDPILRGVARLPDLSIVSASSPPLYYLIEPCDAAFEGLRLAIENHLPAHCIDLDVDNYPLFKERLPDPYAITHIGLKEYFNAYRDNFHNPLDQKRELHMARRLKELSLRHEKVLFIGGFAHVTSVLKLLDQKTFPTYSPCTYSSAQLSTLTEESAREVMAETGWVTRAYETWRQEGGPIDRQQLLLDLYKAAGKVYEEETGAPLRHHQLATAMKFSRNYALFTGRLTPNFYQTLVAAQGCVDHNYAYAVWLVASEHTPLKNVDNLPEKALSVEDIWGFSKRLRFHLRAKQQKGNKQRFFSPSPYTICSYPPEDQIVETFGNYLKKKGAKVQREGNFSTLPFTASLEDGIDARETIRHWHEGKIYVKKKGRPPQAASSVVVIFEEDPGDKYRWYTTWIGEHDQESDMAFYATPMTHNIVGPGISRCEYGGMMLSSPPRRLFDVWRDPDYSQCASVSEVLLMSAIDYATLPAIVYVAKKPPTSKMKTYAARFGKKVVYIPIGQLSPALLGKIRVFHVLDGPSRREVAGDYIF